MKENFIADKRHEQQFVSLKVKDVPCTEFKARTAMISFIV